MSSEFNPFAGPEIVGTAPTTEHQREIWNACQLGDEASLAYNESIRLELEGNLDAGALQRALNVLVHRHEILSAGLSGDGQTLLLTAPTSVLLEVLDLSGFTPEEREQQLRVLYEREVSETFDLSSFGLYRAKLVRISPNQSVFVFTAHHIICDGWSIGVIVQDLAKLYTEEVLGFDHGAAVSLTYGQYARNEANRDADTARADDEHFIAQLGGQLPLLDLPLDHTRPARRSFRSRREDHRLSSELVQRLRRLSADRRSSLFSTLLSAFAAVIGRLANQEEVILGVPFAGQSLTGQDDLVGHAVNMLPLRLTVAPNVPFTDHLANGRRVLLDAQEHQSTTLGRLLQKLPIGRDPSRPPLFSVTFNLDKGIPAEALAFQGLVAHLHTNPRRFENFEIFVNAVELDGNIDLECQYAADLFDARTIRRLLSVYERFLLSVVENPAEEVGRLALTPDEDLDGLTRLNRTNAEFPEGVTVDELIRRRANEDLTRIACETVTSSLSYGALLARAEELSLHLRAKGVGPGAFVGVCMERSEHLLVSLLAVWFSGAAYVPLDPDYPAERLKIMVEDSAMHVLLTSQHVHAELPLGVETTLFVDALPERPGLAQHTPIRSAEDPAYVIFTSGSTGRPKGVVVPHRSVVNLLGSVARTPGLSPSDVVLAITTLSFDIAVSEIWLPLFVGAKIVLTTRDIAADGQLLREWIESRGVTFIDATPATYRLLLAAGWKGNASLKLICTGEAMPLDLARQLLSTAGEVWNGYGPTETTVWSTFWKAQPGLDRVLIGRPVDNTQIYILDENKNPVPLGTRGEIYIGGAGVSLGYLGRPDLTTERFVADPFTQSSHPEGNAKGWMYRTGDLGRYLSNGDLECLGRNDHQVKLRGFRIELGEIESALAAHPSLRQATVILREDTPGDAKLVAYVQAEGDAPSPSTLRTHLKSLLPDYMIPAGYVTMADFPLTPSGKIDRKALPAPEAQARAVTSEFVAPRTPTEALLAELWAEVLRLGRVSIDEDFFALGGHSLLASQILSRLRRDHGIELSFRKFFEAPTIARLAEAVDSAQQSGTPRRQPPVPRAPGAPVPLSISQERVFLLEEMDPAQRVTHNLPAAWEFRGPVDLNCLQKSLDNLVRRHETLRTTFGGPPGKPEQRVLHNVELPITFHDLRALSEDAKRPAMMEEIERVSHEPFDLERGPLFRSHLFQFEDERFIYFSLRHNIVWDGWSFDIFLGELATGYGAFARGEDPKLPELPLSYGDFAIWQRNELESKAMAERVEWWKSELKNAPADMDLPKDYPRLTQSSYAGGNAKLTLSKDYSTKLTEVAHQAGTTFFMALYASYVALLHRYSLERDLLVGLPVRGRYLPEFERLIGPFTNTIVLRSQVDPKDSFLQHLKKVRDRSLEAFSHEETPLELLSEHLPPVRALFSFQDTRERPQLLGNIPIEQTDVEHPAAANDLMVWAVERHNKIIAIANYNAEIFERSSIERFLRSFEVLLDSVIANPACPIGELELIHADDRRSLDAPAETISASSALDLFERKFALEKDVVAFTDGTTYGTLSLLVDRVATCLKEAGLHTGDRLAVEFSPGPELFATLAAAWRLGAAPIPVSPHWPRSLVRRVIDKAAAQLIVSQVASEDLSPAQVILWEKVLTTPPAPITKVDSRTALLQPAFDGAGQLTFIESAHSDLLAAATAWCRQHLSNTNDGALWLEFEPFFVGFGLHLLAPALTNRPLYLSKKDETDSLLDAFEAQTVTAVSASSWLLATAWGENARFPDRTILWGSSTKEQLAAFSEKTDLHIAVALRTTSAPKPLPVFFGQHFDPKTTGRLGRLQHLGSILRVLDEGEREVPFGVCGELHLDIGAHAPIQLGRGRLHTNGDVETGIHPGATLAYWLEASDLAALARSSTNGRPTFARLENNEIHGSELVLYYEGQTGLSDANVRRALRDLVPGLILPRLLSSVETWPSTKTGELDESRLESPLLKHRRQLTAPRNKSEELLIQLVRTTLGKTEIGVHDNFFALGGHSLACLRLVAAVERETGRRISPRIFLLNTLAQAAQLLEDAEGPTATSHPPHPEAPESTPENQRGFGRFFRKGIQGLFGGND